MISFSLLILSPPQDIELEIRRLQSDIFSRCGFTSAMALPVMLPLCRVPDNIGNTPDKIGDSRIRKALVSHSFTGFPMATSYVTDAGGSLFLSIKETNMLASLINQCRGSMRILQHTLRKAPESISQDAAESGDAGKLIFPFYRGFFLAQNESGGPENEIAGKIIPPLLDFNFFTLSILRINIYADISSWWENIDWEIPFSVNCKKISAH